MIRSMTGYGEAERATPVGRLRVELRAVNHRHFHVNAKLATPLLRWEAELREWLRGHFPRGSIGCTVRLVAEDGIAPERRYRIDESRLRMYLSLLREIGDRFDVPGEPDLALLTRYLNEILVPDDADAADAELDPADLRAVVEQAAQQTLRMREEEGRRLAADLDGRLDAIEAALGRIEAAAPERLVAERDRLRAAVRELAAGFAVDETRLAQEIAYLAERWDVNEELVRFRSHIELFRELCGAAAEEPVGKRLSFLVQEMHREANTIGSKANDARIAHQVVGMKDEIERLREQVENVE